MASIDQLETALRNADAAGDTAAATQLAQAISSMRAPSIGSEIASGVSNAVKSAGQSVADFLNPFSEARHASYEAQAKAPIGEGFMENLRQIGGTGAALATPITAPGAVAGEAITPLVAHPFHALNRAIGTDIPYSQAKDQASLALMGLAPRGFSPTGPRPTPAPLPSATDLKGAGSAVYNDPAIKSIPLPSSDINNVGASIRSDLRQQGFRPTTGNAPGTFSEIDALNPPNSATASTSPLFNVDDLRSSRRALSITAGLRDQTGRPTPDAAAASQAIEKINKYLDTVAPQLREANANYSAGKSAETLDYRKMMADRRAAKTGSGSNIENTMRQEVDKIPNRGLTKDEQALKNTIVEGTPARNALRKVGKLGFGDGLSLMYHAAAAPLTAGLSLPFGMGATAGRKIGEMLTRSQIKQLSEMMRSRAPLAKSAPMVMPSLNKNSALAALLLRQVSPSMFPAVVPAYADKNK